MKKLYLATAAFLALAGSASAADLAARPYTKAPPMMAPAYDWSGFYIGANGGYASSHKCWDIVGPAAGIALLTGGGTSISEGCHDADGGVVGGQIGYNWQVGAWVFGLEAQGDYARLRGSNDPSFFAFAGTTNRSRVDALGLFTGRVGYAWNNTMLYVKGGAAVADDRYDYYATATGTTLGIARESRWGGVVGVGIEYGFTPNWSAGVEYDHAFLGRRDIGFAAVNGGTPGVVERIRQDVDMVTARVSYRWGGPVVARY